jgi:hypothetical protein
MLDAEATPFKQWFEGKMNVVTQVSAYSEVLTLPQVTDHSSVQLQSGNGERGGSSL